MSELNKKNNELVSSSKHWTFKLGKDGYTYAVFTIKQTYNNFFMTLTDLPGTQVYKKLSGGASGFRGTKRRTQAAAEIVAEQFLTEFLDDFCTIWNDMRIIVIFYGKPNIIVNTIIDVLSDKLPFYLFFEAKKIPHNGMRKRKIRRILVIF